MVMCNELVFVCLSRFTKVDKNSLKSFKFSAALCAEKGACFSYGCAPRLQRSDRPWLSERLPRGLPSRPSRVLLNACGSPFSP